jgi:alpha-D-xyloside xylohydrolase
MQKTVQHTLEDPGALEVWIYKGSDALCSNYNDDGISYDFKKCKYEHLRFEWDDAGKRLTIREYSRFRNTPITLQINCGGAQRTVSFDGSDLIICFD